MSKIACVLLFLVFLCDGVCAQEHVCGTDRVVVPLRGNGNINVVILGDSNTSIGGDACDNPRGWNKWFKDKFAPDKHGTDHI